MSSPSGFANNPRLMTSDTMNDQQLLRYSRHILLPEIGIEGQQKLLNATALQATCERAELAGGTLTMQSQTGQGTRVVLKI